jgi:hypothetical protein
MVVLIPSPILSQLGGYTWSSPATYNLLRQWIRGLTWVLEQGGVIQAYPIGTLGVL